MSEPKNNIDWAHMVNSLTKRLDEKDARIAELEKYRPWKSQESQDQLIKEKYKLEQQIKEKETRIAELEKRNKQLAECVEHLRELHEAPVYMEISTEISEEHQETIALAKQILEREE